MNSNKYEWHDLRKNPDDVPIVDTDIILYIDGAYAVGRYCYREADEEYGFDGFYFFMTDDVAYDEEEPTAWAYIRPFCES